MSRAARQARSCRACLPKPTTWTIHKGVEVAGAGQNADGYFGWHYPPPFLLIAAALAIVSYPTALIASDGREPAALSRRHLRIVRTRGAMLPRSPGPRLPGISTVGQNGFLTAALLGSGLAMVEKRPVPAGILIGLLTYRPQFGLLIPIALMAGGHWRVFWSAAASATALAILSALVLGVEPWIAFLNSAVLTNKRFWSSARPILPKLLSVSGYVRSLGSSVGVAWLAHGAAIILMGAVVASLWHRKVDLRRQGSGTRQHDDARLALYLCLRSRRAGRSRWPSSAEPAFSRIEIATVVVAGALVLLSPAEHVADGPDRFASEGSMAILRLRWQPENPTKDG